MIKFNYKAMTPDGQPRNGVIEAPVQARAVQMLQQNGLVVVNVSSSG